FPELAICGYPPMDLLERSSFVEAGLRALDAVVAAVDEPVAVVGFVEPSRGGAGKPLYNSAAVVHRRQVVGVHRKVLLPTYDVFDEGRYFEPGPEPRVIEVAGARLGVTVCEDIWNDKAVWSRAPYHEHPVDALAAQRPDLIVNVSASPFHVGKLATRARLALGIAGRHGVPVAYANLVGGNDGLVFDGESFVVSGDGRVLAVAGAFREDLARVPPGADGPGIDPAGFGRVTPTAAIVDALCLGIRDFLGKLGIRKAVLGLSGGIDSAVVAGLAVRALGPEAVTCIGMPSRYTGEESRRDAATTAAALGATWMEVPIDGVFQAYVDLLAAAFGGRPGGLTEENLQARVRGAILMAVSNRTGALVLNTGNKSEMAVGYSTLYGDMVGGLAVIGDLTKAMVYEVARELNREREVIPEFTLVRPPSAELRPDQKDEDSLPPYPVLDPIVRAYVEDGLDPREIVASGFAADTVATALRMIGASEFKRRQAPVALKVTAKAFGVGRRYPIVQRFREPMP
ncbi:MAG: NAD+ synthase, partial [Deltaproteobacteria bacterium]|nr:NAD+ synthase [Deltaproteobacteria bacterium]